MTNRTDDNSANAYRPNRGGTSIVSAGRTATRRRALAAAVVVATGLATVVVSPPVRAQACGVTMLPGTHGLDTPVAQGMIKAMPDGNMWFGEGASIARVTSAPPHTIRRLLTTPPGVTNDVAAGPDGNYWFTEIIGNKIGRISPHEPHAMLEIPLPVDPLRPVSQPDSIVAGPDGHLWFTLWSGQIGRISTWAPHAIDLYKAPGSPRELVVGREGQLWYTNHVTNAIGRVTLQPGADPLIHEFPVPTDNARPVGLAVGRDGTIWFTEGLAGRVGWFDPHTPEEMTELKLAPNSGPVDIALGPDGDLWFTETTANLIGRLRPRGRDKPPTLTECSVPESPWFLDAGPDGAIWFTTFHNPGIQIGRITPDATHPVRPRTDNSAKSPQPADGLPTPAAAGGKLPDTR